MDPLYKLFVWTALTLVFVVFAANPLQAATDDAIKNDARLNARRIASTINILSTAPDGTTFLFEMPNSRCTATITDSFVSLKITPATGQELTETIGLIITDTDIRGGEFECRSNPSLRFTKTFGVIEITGV